MKNFQIMRYLSKYKTWIAAASLICGVLFYIGAQLFFQTYNASTIIEYTGEGAYSGLSPDGTKIDPNELKSTNIVSKALSSLNISQTNVDSIRESISIEPVISEEQQLLQESKLELGEEYEVNPTRYLVTLSTSVLSGKEYPRLVLNEILSEYNAFYGETHVNSQGGTNGINDIYSKNYDYIEMMEVIDGSLESTLKYLNDKINAHPSFRSYDTGYSFSDLASEFSLIQNVKAVRIASKILSEHITKDRDVLLEKYNNRNNTMTITNETSIAEINNIIGVINTYVQMMSNSDNTNITSEYILDDVHENYIYDEEGNYRGIDQTTEYDDLLEGYVRNRDTYEDNLIDIAYNQYVLSVYEAAPQASSQQVQEETEASIRALVDEVNALYDILHVTNDEYNEFLGAQNIHLITSVGVSERIPVALFTAFVVVIFGVVGCAGAIIIGRVEDIIEYYAFTNKVDGLPNRAKCDMYIAQMAKKSLPSQFVCAAFKITNLKEENIRLGRGVGDSMMKSFANALIDVFEPSDAGNFVGYNGSGQYIAFIESMSKSQMEACILQFVSLIASVCEDEKYNIEYQYGVAYAEEEKCYDIRKLLSMAISRIGSTPDPTPRDKVVDLQHIKEEAIREALAKKSTADNDKRDISQAKEDYYLKFKSWKTTKAK